MESLDLDSSVQDRADASSQMATNKMKLEVDPRYSLEALDLITGDLLRSNNELLTATFSLWSNSDDTPPPIKQQEIEDTSPLTYLDPYYHGISPITDDHDVTTFLFTYTKGSGFIRDWRIINYSCHNSPHFIFVAPNLPLIIVSPPTPTDFLEDYNTRELNQPPTDENPHFLCGGLQLRDDMWHAHRKQVSREHRKREKEEREERARLRRKAARKARIEERMRYYQQDFEERLWRDEIRVRFKTELPFARCVWNGEGWILRW